MALTVPLLVLVIAFITAGIGEVSSQRPSPRPTQTKLRFANIYGDHMVLQQSPAKANIWGYVAKCDSKLTATFNGMKYSPRNFTDPAGNCTWIFTLPATKADAKKTYTITVSSDKYGSASIRDVMFGDVWVCSGQSNMEFTVPQAFNAADEIEDANKYPLIRLFTAANVLSQKPQRELLDIAQNWSIASSKSVGGGNWTYFSATCWFFGRALFKSLKYPIGLIATDWGGTPVEAWSSPDALRRCHRELEGSPIMENAKKLDGGTPPPVKRADGPSSPSVLWNAMIRPFINMTIMGAVWYQGESNSWSPYSYNCTFPAMIDDWREKWSKGSHNQTKPLYFGFVQLAPTGNSNVSVGGFPVIRWAQTANYGYVPNKKMQNVFMAVAIDLGDPTSPFGSVHPRDKQDVGIRLANGARAVVYNDTKVYYLGMLAQSAKRSTTSSRGVTTISVAFGPVDERGKLELRYKYGFEIGCGVSKTATAWVEGTAKKVSGNSVIVEFPLCKSPLRPIQLRYCWRTDPCSFGKCPVYSSPMNPAPPFIMNLE